MKWRGMEQNQPQKIAKNNEQISSEILDNLEKQKHKEVVNLIAKMIIDITLSEENENGNSLFTLQQ